MLALPCLLAAQAPQIGIVDIYGLQKTSEQAVRKKLGLGEGDPLPRSKGDVEIALESLPGVVRARLEAACCEHGKAILYVGIEEKGAAHFDYRQPPEGITRLPEEIHHAYAHFLSAVAQAARRGEASEDLSSGHSLLSDPAVRAVQEQFAALAAEHLPLLRDVLRDSFDEEHRAIAAYVIGYAPRKQEVVDDLQYALRDPDDTVRNNALRSLTAIATLALRKPELQIRVSATWPIEMLNSIIWSDRHAAAVALVTLTEARDQSTLDHLRNRALRPLLEMGAWKHLPHALPACILLGRLAGMEEKEIQDIWSRGEREKLLKAFDRHERK